MTNYESLTDQELIEALATKVMGWKKWYWEEPAHGRAWGWVSAKHYASHRDKNKCDAYWDWNPLGDYELNGLTVKGNWNHTMEVVAKSKGDPEELASLAFSLTKQCGEPQRAICLAALQVVESLSSPS